jgi:hypothetical protein
MRFRSTQPAARGTAGRVDIMAMTESLSRRLERLEEQVAPLAEPKVWKIVIVDSDGSCRDGETITWRPPRPVQRRPRLAPRQMTI